MDPRRFDAVARRLADSLSRRAVVGGSLWAAFLAALPSGETVLGKNRRQLRQRRQHDREQEQRQREHDRNRRDKDHNRNQRGKNNGGGAGKGGGNDERGDGKNRNRDRDQNRNSKDNDTRNSNQNVQGEGCLNNGKRCGKGKKLKPCSRCCSGFNITTRSKKKKCACRPDGRGCQDNSQCCARVCDQGVCGALS